MKIPETDPANVVVLCQKQVALSQLDRAVLLFMNEKDFVASVTLACAAECIFGEALKDAGINTPTDVIKGILRDKFAPALTPKQVNDEAVNRARNFFKHKVGDIEEPTEFDLQTEAISAIARAICHAGLVTGELSEHMIAFFEWLKANRPELRDTEELDRELSDKQYW
ncbi:MAG: hypothetical protein M0T84_05250 [Betaproteobacteria bacterium]|nr:hypothetical protein [Betaproteobacteria bacterium]